jgi:para-nitrobenzyl esterase
MGTISAQAFGHICPQRDLGSDAVLGDEDCLTLNVWTPAETPAAPLPVLFFIHGGGNIEGSSAMPVLDGTHLAQHGPAVVVTANYRLGTLGFLLHPALSAESEHDASGNYGLLDLVEALRWVQRNITAFGGDKARVLVFGQSGGARDACLLVASPVTHNLFSRALVLSGGCDVMPTAAAERSGLGVAASLGCNMSAPADVSACLRAKSTRDIVLAPAVFGDGGDPASFPLTGDKLPDRGYKYPPIDGYFLPSAPVALFAAGRHQHMPVVMSTTASEFATIYDLDHFPALPDDNAYRSFLRGRFGPTFGDAVMAHYPRQYGSAKSAAIAALSDSVYVCPTRRAMRAITPAQQEPAWRAVYTHVFEAGPLRQDGAAHGFDMFLGFHNLGAYPLSPAEQQLGDAIAGMWQALAAVGDPSRTEGVAGWRSYSAQADDAELIDDTLTSADGIRTAQCDFWDSGT